MACHREPALCHIGDFQIDALAYQIGLDTPPFRFGFSLGFSRHVEFTYGPAGTCNRLVWAEVRSLPSANVALR